MSLPSVYVNSDTYFKDALEFLSKYAWIYQHSNTAFIKADVFSHYSDVFEAYFSNLPNKELNEFPLLQPKNEAGEKINKFCEELRRLIPAQAFTQILSETVDSKCSLKLRKMNLKKQHEIIKLAQVVNDLCKDDIDMLIDFGAGLGYLSEMIFQLSNNKFIMLGLEADATRVEAAKKRQTDFMPNAAQKCAYKQQFITEKSAAFITESIAEIAAKNDLQSPKVAIVGLHACADLSITAIKLFFEMGEHVKKLIIMPCCYHKLEFDAADGDKIFRNFPLSQTLKAVVNNYENYTDFLNRPFLRLACQQTLARWRNMSVEEHKKHGIDMLRRGIAEAIIDANMEYVVKSKSSKKYDSKANETCVPSFLEFCQFYELHSKVDDQIMPWTDLHEFKYGKLSEKFGANGHSFAEGLTCLQTAMQKLCENIVLYDRLCYIEEHAALKWKSGVEQHEQQEQQQQLQQGARKTEYAAVNRKVNVRYEKLLDEKLSPRCYVLIAEKL